MALGEGSLPVNREKHPLQRAGQASRRCFVLFVVRVPRTWSERGEINKKEVSCEGSLKISCHQSPCPPPDLSRCHSGRRGQTGRPSPRAARPLPTRCLFWSSLRPGGVQDHPGRITLDVAGPGCAWTSTAATPSQHRRPGPGCSSWPPASPSIAAQHPSCHHPPRPGHVQPERSRRQRRLCPAGRPCLWEVEALVWGL